MREKTDVIAAFLIFEFCPAYFCKWRWNVTKRVPCHLKCQMNSKRADIALVRAKSIKLALAYGNIPVSVHRNPFKYEAIRFSLEWFIQLCNEAWAGERTRPASTIMYTGAGLFSVPCTANDEMNKKFGKGLGMLEKRKRKFKVKHEMAFTTHFTPIINRFWKGKILLKIFLIDYL